MNKGKEKPTVEERLYRAAIIGAVIWLPYILGFLAFFFIAAKILVVRYWPVALVLCGLFIAGLIAFKWQRSKKISQRSASSTDQKL